MKMCCIQYDLFDGGHPKFFRLAPPLIVGYSSRASIPFSSIAEFNIQQGLKIAFNRALP
jgi:hypothetical protein